MKSFRLSTCASGQRVYSRSICKPNATAQYEHGKGQGYEKEYCVPEREIEHIPWLLLSRGLIVYGYVLKIWPGEMDDRQQAFVKRVEQSIVIPRTKLGL